MTPQVTELRIGNIVNMYNHGWYWGRIITSRDIWDIAQGTDGPPNDAFFEGIELTPEWMERFGFLIGGTYCTLHITRNNALEWYNDEMNLCYGTYYDSTDPVPCKYVHQLQNLYFALTGTELEYKP